MKTQISISIDAHIASLAKEKLSGRVSAICEQALRVKMMPKKADMPEDNLALRCSKCDEIVERGYFCEIKKIFNGEACEKAKIHSDIGPRMKYPCRTAESEHSHILVPGDNEENLELALKIQNEIRSEE